MLLEVWQVLFGVSEALLSTLPGGDQSEVFTIAKLLKYAPSIQKQELLDLLSSWRGFDSRIASKIIDFFSYGAKTKGELWGHPLVDLGGDELAPVLAPIRYGNIERTFELWMKDGGMNLSEKGPLFEDHVRLELAHELQRYGVLTDAAIHPTKLTVKAGGGSEEIDLVIRIKNTIILVEAKCLLFPADPIEFSRYFEVVSDASRQVKRKVEFARRYTKELMEKLGLVKSTRLDEIAIHPCVLINQPFAAGFSVEGVPVADELIITRFFEGKWHRMARVNNANDIDAEETTLLYANEDEASSSLFTYLQNPPQLLHYAKFVKPSVEWYPAVGIGDRKLAVTDLNVVLPLPNLTFAKNPSTKQPEI